MGRTLSWLVGAVASMFALGLACSSTEQAGAPDAGGDSVAPLPDAEAETEPPADGGLPLDGCVPAPMSAFQPVGIRALILPVCTDAQIHELITTCALPDASSAIETCQALRNDPANRVCFNCLFTAYSATPVTPGVNPIPPAWDIWGPIITVTDTNEAGAFELVNAGACIALADPSSAACGQSMSAYVQCETAACAANCSLPRLSDPPEKTSANVNAMFQCMTLAGTTGCRSLADACIGKLDAGPAAFCASLRTDVSAIEKLARLQCGMPADSGAVGDAGDAGGALDGG